ncbi:unnamed protein product [Caretta caretta]
MWTGVVLLIGMTPSLGESWRRNEKKEGQTDSDPLATHLAWAVGVPGSNPCSPRVSQGMGPQVFLSLVLPTNSILTPETAIDSGMFPG